MSDKELPMSRWRLVLALSTLALVSTACEKKPEPTMQPPPDQKPLSSLDQPPGATGAGYADPYATPPTAAQRPIDRAPIDNTGVIPPPPREPRPAAPTAGAAKAPSASKTYVVKKGDTLSEIAQKFYGDSSQWKKIQRANNIKDPKVLRVGQKLVIP
jgi:nucleoid-associated protein YgaU